MPDATNCNACHAPATTQFKHLGPLCESCFCASVEKRVRKNTNFAPQTPINIFDDQRVNALVAEHILTAILKGPWKIQLTRTLNLATVLAWSADDEAAARLNAAITGTPQPRTPTLPLSTLTHEELLTYAHAKGITGAHSEQTPIQKLFLTLEQKSPGAITNLAKNLRPHDYIK